MQTKQLHTRLFLFSTASTYPRASNSPSQFAKIKTQFRRISGPWSPCGVKPSSSPLPRAVPRDSHTLFTFSKKNLSIRHLIEHGNKSHRERACLFAPQAICTPLPQTDTKFTRMTITKLPSSLSLKQHESTHPLITQQIEIFSL